jgi:hypothetical protein
MMLRLRYHTLKLRALCWVLRRLRAGGTRRRKMTEPNLLENLPPAERIVELRPKVGDGMKG